MDFWRGLERVAGSAAPEVVWLQVLGPGYPAGSNYLRPNGRVARSLPCVVERGCGCQHEIVIHGDDDIVAVCRCEIGCNGFTVRTSDLILYELNRLALDLALANILELHDRGSQPTDFPATTRIGVFSPAAGIRFPVFFTIPSSAEGFDAVADGLVARGNGPFLLLAPTRQLCRPGTEQRLTERRSQLIVLDEIVTIEDGGGLRLAQPRESLLKTFCAANLQFAQRGKATQFFSTPPNAEWNEVAILFRDGHTVAVSVGVVTAVFSYSDMGMADGRNKEPTVQWKLLEAFAQRNGVFNWDNPLAGRKRQKHKENLANDLRRFFRIDGDPFELDRDGQGWHACFRVAYDESPTATHRVFAKRERSRVKNVKDINR